MFPFCLAMILFSGRVLGGHAFVFDSGRLCRVSNDGRSVINKNKKDCGEFWRKATASRAWSYRESSSGVPLYSRRLALSLSNGASDSSEESADDTSTSASPGAIDLSLDARLYKVRLPRAMGIDWKTDLSFRWVSVRGMDPTGAARLSNQIQIGDQLCELTPIVRGGQAGTPINLLGAPFDTVMQSFAELGASVVDVDLVFFRGTKDELKAVCTGDGVLTEPDTITVTVIQNKGNAETKRILTAPAGVNLRELLVSHNINVYQSVTRWTNCKGKQLCGTCIVNVADGGINTNRKSMDEASTLRENPDGYRLSCVTFAYGDVTVETFPPVNPSQWTR